MVDYVRLCEWVAILWKIQSLTGKKRNVNVPRLWLAVLHSNIVHTLGEGDTSFMRNCTFGLVCTFWYLSIRSLKNYK